MAEWLRQFQRAKADAADDEKPKEHQDMFPAVTRPLGLTRPPSCASLASEGLQRNASMLGDISVFGDSDDDHLTNPPTPSSANATGSNGSYPRNIDDIWYQPTLDQIADTLFVALMNKPCHEPLPLEYDTWVRRLVQGCAELSRDLRETRQLLAEEKETLKQSVGEFTEMSVQWEERETAYKAEIRRLEVLLAKAAPSGVEAVLVARSGSIVDRSLAGTTKFRASVQKACDTASAIDQKARPGLPDATADKAVAQQRRAVTQGPFPRNAGSRCNESPPNLDSSTEQWSSPAPLPFSDQAMAEVTDIVTDRGLPSPNRSIKRECTSRRKPSVVRRATADDVKAGGPEEGQGKPRHRRTFSFKPGADKLSLPGMCARMNYTRDASDNT